MKLALWIPSLVALPFVAFAGRSAPEALASEDVRWRPIGAFEPHWHSIFPDEEDPDAVWGALPADIARVAREYWLPDSRLVRGNGAWMPDGREFWLLEADPEYPHLPNDWLLLVRDPGSGAASPRPVVVTNEWIHGERPLVRFVDLDDDERYEVAIRQFDHNGTMWNADVVEYYAVLDDLSLRLDLRQTTEVVDLWSKQERGAIRSQLLSAGDGRLRCVVWRENLSDGVPRVPHGHLEYERGEEGWFRVASEVSVLGAGEKEQRYDWTISMAGTHPIEKWERNEARIERGEKNAMRYIRPVTRHR